MLLKPGMLRPAAPAQPVTVPAANHAGKAGEVAIPSACDAAEDETLLATVILTPDEQKRLRGDK
jgi:hypothetical protein